MKRIKYILTLLIALTCSAGLSMAQDSAYRVQKIIRKANREVAKAADIKRLIDSKNFVFQAQYANPLGGGVTTLNGRLINITPNVGGGSSGHVYLNYNYDVRIRPDSVIAYLPYFGRTTFAPAYNPNDNGVKFTSTKFGYSIKQGKKGSTTITITPQDAGYNRKMILNISSSGSASLQMIITNRDAISYDGFIAEK